MDIYVNKTKEYKIEADSFLSTHHDIKEEFNKLKIDEDFLFNQNEQINTEYIK